MEDNTKNSYDNYLTSTHAFSSLDKIATSYNDGLTNSIIELVKSKENLYMSDIIEKYGSYPQVHGSVKRLLLENKLVLYETAPNSLANNDYQTQKITMVDSSLSNWLDMAAQPCLTCAHTAECAINNPVSPATCNEFNQWLDAELELDLLD